MSAPKHLQSPIDKYGDLSTLFGIVGGMLLAKGATEQEMHESLSMLIRTTLNPDNATALDNIGRTINNNVADLRLPKPE